MCDAINHKQATAITMAEAIRQPMTPPAAGTRVPE